MPPTDKINLGRWGEKLAAWYLEGRGYFIKTRHFTSRFGEIDIIAQDKDCLVFVEVKTRLGTDYGLPEEAVNRRKRLRLKRAIFAYLSQNEAEDFRLDMIAITYLEGANKVVIRHHKSLSDNPF